MTWSTSLLTDHYELTMLQEALEGGTAGRRSVFEVFTRRLPEGRRYGVVAGTGRLLDGIERFRFDDDVLGLGALDLDRCGGHDPHVLTQRSVAVGCGGPTGR